MSFEKKITYLLTLVPVLWVFWFAHEGHVNYEVALLMFLQYYLGVGIGEHIGMKSRS